MASRQRSVFQEDYSLGSVLDVSPALIPANGLSSVVNAILSEDGSPARRGGVEYKSDAAFGSTGTRFLWDAYFDAGQRTLFANESDFGTLAANDASPVNLGSDGLAVPKASALVAGLLFVGGGWIYAGSRKTASYTTAGGNTNITNGSVTVTDASGGFTANVDAGMLMQVGNERVYVVASVTNDTTLVLADVYEGATTTTANPVFHNIYKITTADPYPAAEFYWTTANRLLWAEDNLVHATEPLKPHDTTATFGPEEVETVHELPEGAQVTGGATVGQTALVFTTQGVWTIEGLVFDIAGPDGAVQHRLQRFSDLRLFGPTGIATYEQTLVVPGADGIYLMDGVSQPVKVSRPISPRYLDYVRAGYRPGQAIAYRGHYLLPILTVTGSVIDLFVCRLDRPVSRRGQIEFPWSFFDNTGAKVTAFAVRIGSTELEPVLLGADGNATSRIFDCSTYFEPDASSETDADASEHAFDLITRDFATGNDTENMVRHVRIRSEESGSEDPALQVAWSDGAPSTGAAAFDEAIFDTDVFGEEGAAFNNITCRVVEEAGGVRVYRCRINEPRRYMRIRVRSREATSSLILRSIELFIRPSGTRRR